MPMNVLNGVRYLHYTDHTPRNIIKVEKDLLKRLEFRDINAPVKIRNIRIEIETFKLKKTSVSI